MLEVVDSVLDDDVVDVGVTVNNVVEANVVDVAVVVVVVVVVVVTDLQLLRRTKWNCCDDTAALTTLLSTLPP